jgi:hypothetical protein
MDKQQYPRELDELLDYMRSLDVQRAYVDATPFITLVSSQIAYHLYLAQYDAAAILINLVFALGFRTGSGTNIDLAVWEDAMNNAFGDVSQ